MPAPSLRASRKRPTFLRQLQKNLAHQLDKHCLGCVTAGCPAVNVDHPLAHAMPTTKWYICLVAPQPFASDELVNDELASAIAVMYGLPFS